MWLIKFELTIASLNVQFTSSLRVKSEAVFKVWELFCAFSRKRQIIRKILYLKTSLSGLLGTLFSGLEIAWFAIHFTSLLIGNWTNPWFENESITIHLPVIFDSIWFFIRRWIMISGWIVIRDESKSNRIKINKIKLNLKSKWVDSVGALLHRTVSPRIFPTKSDTSADASVVLFT